MEPLLHLLPLLELDGKLVSVHAGFTSISVIQSPLGLPLCFPPFMR